MDWVKLTTDYFDDLEIVLGSDAEEVMFTRGLALAGKIEEHGFIPEAMLSRLTRRPATAKRTAAALVRRGLWAKVRGGYQIESWERIQAELERLVAKKKRDRDRKRAERAASRDMSMDVSADSPAPGPVDRLLNQEEELERTAAAAALPGHLDVLRAKLQAHTPLRALRFDSLTAEQRDRIGALLEVHGDDPLVRVAIDTCRNPPPVHVGAFLGSWEAMPAPGTRRLGVVRPRLCEIHQTTLTPSGACTSCASDQKAAR